MLYQGIRIYKSYNMNLTQMLTNNSLLKPTCCKFIHQYQPLEFNMLILEMDRS